MNTIPFEKSFASHEKSKYWSLKNELKPEQVYKVTAKKYYFDCDKCEHEFINNPSHVSNGRWCPYCCIPQKKLCGSKDCTDCFEKSFASHEKSVFWSDKNELKPEFVLKKGDKKIWFNCDECNHDFETQIKAVTISNHWCPYCVNQKLCDNNECKECFNKSFASHEKAKFWSSKNSISPRQIFKGSGKKYWFDCDKCCHEFYMSLTHISGRNSWCPYCSNKQMCDNDDCKECFNKSFASHEKAKFWSLKNTKNPRHLFQGDSDRYWFNCDKCSHDFETLLYNVKSGYWCPYCVNKTETKLYKILKEKYPTIIHQFKVEWCKNKTYLPFDFCIPEYKIIIELDGPQHFIQIMNWKSPEEQLITDTYKEKSANQNGFSIIRLLQPDVLTDKYDWLYELTTNIDKIISEGKVQNIYMCKNDEYKDFDNEIM
jgi:very-short-patch-repair endonuclease